MDVRCTRRIAAVALSIALFSPFSVAQSTHSGYDPAAHQGSSKPQDGFVDFTLQRINPSDVDYGKCLGEGRTLLVEDSVEHGYFWSNVVALGLFGCLFIIIVFQHRVQATRDWTAAEMLGQVEQTLARANAQVEEATKRNRVLTESLAVLKQSTPQSQPLPADTVDRTPFRPTRSHTASSQASTATAPKGNGGQIALVKPEVELVTKVNVLEQQLGRSHELEKHLRRQLNETGKKLQAEQERHRSLKGE